MLTRNQESNHHTFLPKQKIRSTGNVRLTPLWDGGLRALYIAQGGHCHQCNVY